MLDSDSAAVRSPEFMPEGGGDWLADLVTVYLEFGVWGLAKEAKKAYISRLIQP